MLPTPVFYGSFQLHVLNSNLQKLLNHDQLALRNLGRELTENTVRLIKIIKLLHLCIFQLDLMKLNCLFHTKIFDKPLCLCTL